MNYENLNSSLTEIARKHCDHPEMYYLGEGDESVVLQCKEILKSFQLFQQILFFDNDVAVPDHIAFPLIREHIGQIGRFYGNRKPELTTLFIRQLIPDHYRPLSHQTLRSMTLFSCMVELHDEKFRPDPILAHVDGYYNFVAPIGDAEIRIPLIPERGQDPVSLPPSIRFVTKPGTDDKAPRLYIINRAPQFGRRFQLHAFLTVLSKSKPQANLFQIIRDAIISFDLSFAIAICALSNNQDDFACPHFVMNILGCNRRFDHLIRSLSCICTQFVAGVAPNDNPEVVALKNIVVATSAEWCKCIQASDSLEELLESICKSIVNRRHVPDVTIYILRSALTISAYENPDGNNAIAMFMELLISPFATKYGMTDQFRELKTYLVNESMPDQFTHLRDLVEDTIIHIMGCDATIEFHASTINDDTQSLYKFINKHLDDFIKVVIFLNARDDLFHPVFRSVYFAYERSQ